MGAKKRILIVEDEKMLQELYYTILTRKQYQDKFEVEKAASAEEALHSFEKQAFDLVFTDYHLPKMDGLTLIKKLSTTVPNSNFILISGYFSPPIIRLALEAGAYTCLKKPCSMYKIVETIEETLRETDRKKSHLKQINEIIKDFQHPALFITAEMQIVFTNELFSKTYNNYQEKKCYDILCPSKQLCFNCPLSTARETHTTINLEHTIKSDWESLISIKEIVEPWRSHTGELYGYVLKLIPTGNRIELPATEEATTATTPVKQADEREFYTFIVDGDDRFLHVDEHFASACEVSPTQMEGKPITAFLHSYFSEYLKKEEKRFAEFAKEHEKKKVKLDFIKQQSNQRFTLTCEFRGIGPGFGPGQKIMVICRDKEESEELTKLIEFERESSKQLMFGQFDMVVSLGSDLSIKTMNNICENKLKIKKQELIGKAFTCLLPKNNDQRFFNQAVKQVDTLKDIYNIRLDIGIKRKVIPTLVNISGIRNHFNNEIGYILVLRDIEKELKMEATLSSIERMQALGQLAAGIAHQINNYTAALAGSTDIFLLDLREEGLTGEKIKELGHEYIKTIKNSLNRLSGLTKHLTTFARAQQRPVISLGSVNKVINDVISLIELNIKKKQILLMVSLDEQLSPIYLSPLHLEQAVMNILMNAIDAVPETGGVIKVKTYQEINWAYITIEDNGPGIPEHIRDQVFEAFVTTKPSGVGTGLGLNVAKDMITSLKGEIELVSEPNAGTKAIIKLPILSQEEIA